MKQKVLISACALAACLGACTNDDYVLEQAANGNSGATTVGEVIGADLASRGMNIVLNGEGIATRAGNGFWENGDRFGLAWYQFGNSPITAPQDSTSWAGTTDKAIQNNIAANHIFTYANGSFTTQSDVYQGAYFVYFPYERQSSASGMQPKTVKVNAAEQTGNFAEDRWNKALQISAQDFINAGAGVNEDEQLTRNFFLSPAVNVLSVNATPDTKIVGESEAINFLKSLSITALTVNAGGAATSNAVFAESATLRPYYIPHVTKKADNVTIDEEKTLKAMDDAAAIALWGETPNNGNYAYLQSPQLVSSVTTNVRNAYTIANVGAEGNGIRVFAFPTPKAVTYNTGDAAPSATVKAGVLENGKLKYELGEFEIEAKDNKAFSEKLQTALGDEDAAYYMGKIIRNADGEWSFINLDANLLLSHFTPLTDDIQSEDQWNDLVKIYDALVELGAIDPEDEDFKAPVFTLSENVTFEGETIATPEKMDITLKTASGKRMRLDNEEGMVWPANLLTDNHAEILVVEGSVLNVGMDSEEIEINATIVNNGTINAGPKVSIGKNNAGKVSNKNGRIVVEYGAYVYPNSNEGIIAYEVENPVNVAHINVLKEGGSKGEANINTLIIPEGVTLDLNAKVADSEGSGDRYNDDSQEGDPLVDLKDINIELNGGDIKGSTKAGEKNAVQNITMVEGESTITDVVAHDITVDGGTLNVASATTPKTPVFLTAGASIEVNNGGTLNANTNIYATEVTNNTGGKLNANSNIYCSGTTDENFHQDGGQTTGHVIGMASTQEAKAVIFVFEETAQVNNLTDATTFLNAVNTNLPQWYDKDSMTGNSYAAVYNTLSAWMVSIGEEAFAADGTHDITEAEWNLFLSLTGYTPQYATGA